MHKTGKDQDLAKGPKDLFYFTSFSLELRTWWWWMDSFCQVIWRFGLTTVCGAILSARLCYAIWDGHALRMNTSDALAWVWWTSKLYTLHLCLWQCFQASTQVFLLLAYAMAVYVPVTDTHGLVEWRYMYLCPLQGVKEEWIIWIVRGSKKYSVPVSSVPCKKWVAVQSRTCGVG